MKGSDESGAPPLPEGHLEEYQQEFDLLEMSTDFPQHEPHAFPIIATEDSRHCSGTSFSWSWSLDCAFADDDCRRAML
jgi:hypothetical protein